VEDQSGRWVLDHPGYDEDDQDDQDDES